MLNNIEYKAYIMDTIAFARTIIVKCEDVALLDNRLIKKYYDIDAGTDKTQWRYYLNLNGQYHSTDDIMTITSLDNGDTIEFNKSNLEIHLATKRAYRLGSYHYTRLVARYPHQSNLISGIINPISPSESVPAKNYQILRYNTDYVLWNEHQLIPALQEFIYGPIKDSFKTEYVYTDNLMLTLLVGHLHKSLIEAILSIRNEADGTRFAHSFYIWSRLNSLGLSSIYKDVLDNKQTMWLYRNLSWVLRKLGRKGTFDNLMDILLSYKKIPMVKYDVLQTTDDMLTTFEPTTQFLSTPINLTKEFGTSTKLFSVNQIAIKQKTLAEDNELLLSQSVEDTDYAVKYGLYSEMPTKVLESTMIDTTMRNPDNVMKVLHNEWVYLTFNNLYNINHDVTDIRTGQKIKLTTTEAFILWNYLIRKTVFGKTPGTIGEYEYRFVRKITPPTVSELRQLGHKDILTEQICKDILNVKIDFPRIITPDGFFSKSKEVFDGMWEHKKLYSTPPNLFISAQRKNAVDACYDVGLAKLTDIETYEEWLDQMGLDFSSYSDEELLDLGWSIWIKVTGWENVNYMTIGDQQKSMINLMQSLTSYTVQYVGSTDTEEGNYNLPYMMLMDGDHWFADGKTSLINDKGDLNVPNLMTVRSDHHLNANQLTGSVNTPTQGTVESTLTATGNIYIPMSLTKIEMPPDISVNIMNNGMTLRQVIPSE